MIYRIPTFCYSFVLLLVCIVDYSSGSSLQRYTREAANDTECQTLKQPDWKIDDLRNVTIDLWPWKCLQVRYSNDSLRQQISETCKDIYTAAANDDIGFVQYYMEKNDYPANVSTRRLLHDATQAGKLRMLKYLIDDKNLTIMTNDTTLLLNAALSGNVDLLKYLIYDKNLTSYGVTRDGNTALHFGAISGQAEMVRFLVDTLKYNVNSEDNDGDTPAHLATSRNVLPTLRCLVEKGAHLNATNKLKLNLLQNSVYYGRLAVSKYLIDEKHMDYEQLDSYKRTALHTSARSGNLSLVKYLADEKKAYLYGRDFFGLTLLHQAIIGRNLDVVKYVIDDLKMSSQIEAKDVMDLTAVMEAVRYGSVPITKYLLDEKRANISAVDFSGHNLLFLAIKERELEVMKYLIEEKGFDVNKKDPKGNTAYKFAKDREDRMPDGLVEYLGNKTSEKKPVLTTLN